MSQTGTWESLWLAITAAEKFMNQLHVQVQLPHALLCSSFRFRATLGDSSPHCPAKPPSHLVPAITRCHGTGWSQPESGASGFLRMAWPTARAHECSSAATSPSATTGISHMIVSYSNRGAGCGQTKLHAWWSIGHIVWRGCIMCPHRSKPFPTGCCGRGRSSGPEMA